MDTTLRVKCPNGAQLQWQALCSCSVPLDGFDGSGPALVCRATEQHRLTAASSSATSTPMGQGSSSRKVPSPLRSLHGHSQGGGVDNPLGLSYLATARAEAEAEDEQQHRGGGPRTSFGSSPSDGEAVLKALKEYGIYDARWAAKNVYMIQGKRVYITQRSGEYVVRVGGSVVPIGNFVEQLHGCVLSFPPPPDPYPNPYPPASSVYTRAILPLGVVPSGPVVLEVVVEVVNTLTQYAKSTHHNQHHTKAPALTRECEGAGCWCRACVQRPHQRHTGRARLGEGQHASCRHGREQQQHKAKDAVASAAVALAVALLHAGQPEELLAVEVIHARQRRGQPQLGVQYKPRSVGVGVAAVRVQRHGAQHGDGVRRAQDLVQQHARCVAVARAQRHGKWRELRGRGELAAGLARGRAYAGQCEGHVAQLVRRGVWRQGVPAPVGGREATSRPQTVDVDCGGGTVPSPSNLRVVPTLVVHLGCILSFIWVQKDMRWLASRTNSNRTFVLRSQLPFPNLRPCQPTLVTSSGTRWLGVKKSL